MCIRDRPISVVLFGSEVDWKAGVIVVSRNHWLFYEISFHQENAYKDRYGFAYLKVTAENQQPQCLVGEVKRKSGLWTIATKVCWWWQPKPTLCTGPKYLAILSEQKKLVWVQLLKCTFKKPHTWPLMDSPIYKPYNYLWRLPCSLLLWSLLPRSFQSSVALTSDESGFQDIDMFWC